MEITNSIKNTGVNDKNIRIFESQYNVPNGMTYNSYLIKDEKIVILDTVDIKEQVKWLENINKELKQKVPDYLVISHLEPDHSGSIKNFIEKYPNTTIVGNKKTFEMLPQFINLPECIKKLEVKEGETLEIGKHKLEFYMAPMVHWPEVMVTYESTEKVLFSADAFGKFGAVDFYRPDTKNVSEENCKEQLEDEWVTEARRYYFGIVGKYGMQVQLLLKKLANKPIRTICPLHGPIIRENLEFYINKYSKWSSYEPEEDGVLIVCASIYGHTLEAAELLKKQIKYKKVELLDITKCDMYQAVASAFKYSTLVLAASSYNMKVFPPMEEFLNKLKDRNYQNRKVAIIENGSWAPSAGKTMKEILANMKRIQIVEPNITIKTSLSDENKKQIEELSKKM